jgi:hypothetical protein
MAAAQKIDEALKANKIVPPDTVVESDRDNPAEKARRNKA